MTQSYLGNIINKDDVKDVLVQDVKANVKLTGGMAVYDDGSSEIAVVPTSGQPAASAVRFIEVDADNTGGAKGDKKAQTYKHGTFMVVKAEGNIPIGSKLRCSTNTAGSLMALADPANSTLAATFSASAVKALIDGLRDYKKFHVADYVAHPTEFRTGANPTAATDGQEIVVQVL